MQYFAKNFRSIYFKSTPVRLGKDLLEISLNQTSSYTIRCFKSFIYGEGVLVASFRHILCQKIGGNKGYEAERGVEEKERDWVAM